MNLNDSPFGSAAVELVELEMSLMLTLEGRVKALNSDRRPCVLSSLRRAGMSSSDRSRSSGWKGSLHHQISMPDFLSPASPGHLTLVRDNVTTGVQEAVEIVMPYTSFERRATSN